eukprot:Selendium_serpulae@DN6249_c0_g1_i1.p1
MEDELTQARELFYMGSYSLLPGLTVAPSNDLAKAECEVLKLRAKLAAGQLDKAEIDRLCQSSTPAEKAIGLMARFTASDDSNSRKTVLDEMQSLLATAGGDATTRTMVASALVAYGEHLGDDRVLEALTIIGEGGPLENQALRTQLLLIADRPDLAEQTQANMAGTYEDAAVTRLAAAWCNLINGSFQESYLTFGDLDTYLGQAASRSSAILQNGKAVANMHRRQWPEALEDLQAVFKEIPTDNRMAGDIGGCEAVTLANLITCNYNLRNLQIAEEKYRNLSTNFPGHPLVTKMKSLDLAFEAFEKSLKA